ncbi:ribosome-inactivating family protein [Xenorhabdus bovienii]|uniref:Ribosome-inactivating family protein n=1 Tax=Xenorhabdus bovienii TaxID=40576 RepID=A0AAJ1N027_XENBV|nr:ribosome-inactivating family protein [Xenorhabdus bovienii]MDE1479514.1 ribosome-inactivating family protein [Xenorhabdus bovienii]MDE9511176.1 ribosome-inactivating family protein [Xenorhabdus bovienii]MDE9522833.1 ribosome-inactivating family protein [Xenorhabdus bovienii]
MKILYSVIAMIILLTQSFISSAKNDYDIDFSTKDNYIESLEKIRKALGSRLPGFPEGQNVYQMDPVERSNHQGITIGLIGINGDNTTERLRFVLDPRDLYVAGFILNSNFYRLSYSTPETNDVTVSGTNSPIQLTAPVNYNRLVGEARSSMQITRWSIGDGARFLSSYTTGQLSPEQRHAIVIFATVISEALRFREIETGIANTALEWGAYSLGARGIILTTNWDNLRSTVPQVSQNNHNIQVNPDTTLNGFNEITAAIGLILYCKPPFGHSVMYSESSRCLADDVVVINHTIWNKETLAELMIITD